MTEPIIPYKNNRTYQICRCCVMDTSDDDIVFDSDGICMRCNEYKTRIEPEWNHGLGHERELQDLINDIKAAGKDQEYDCILGLSGGLDSTYMLHLAVKEWGLRPYVLHIDAGWNLPIAEENIQRVVNKLRVKLHVEKLNWNEMREMQIAWFKTGLPVLDAPQDHAFIALVDRYAQELNIKYILNGYNITTEAIADPSSWSRGAGPTGDSRYMKDVIRKHCSIPIEHYTFTNGFKHKVYLPYIKGIKTVKPLNLVSFTKDEMIETLTKEYGYVPYGQKHFEDLLTKFLEGYWAPKRFGHDIRRAWLSTLVITNQISREAALKELEQPPISDEEGEELLRDVAGKLEISTTELLEYLTMPESTVKYKSNAAIYRLGIKTFELLGLERRIRK